MSEFDPAFLAFIRSRILSIVLMVPATNNGNEGTNGRFNNDFGVHPNFWNFLWGVKDVMSKADTDIRQLL